MNEFPSWLEWLPDGMESWEALVAVATILVAVVTGCLAFATFWLAKQTRSDVRASTKAADASARAADIAEASFASSIRPILVNVVENGAPRVQPAGGGHVLKVSVPLRNVGGGLALLEGPSLEITSRGYQRLESRSRAAALPVGEHAPLVFELHCESDAAKRALEQQITQNGFHVVAPYRDLDGAQPGRTRAQCEYLETVGWSVTKIELFKDDETDPFAVLPGRSVAISVSDRAVGDSSSAITS